MNKETYEALKRIIGEAIEAWIDEVAKEHTEDKACKHENIEKGQAEICSDCHEIIDFQIEEDQFLAPCLDRQGRGNQLKVGVKLNKENYETRKLKWKRWI